MPWDFDDILSANADVFGTETLTLSPPRTEDTYECTQVQWNDQQTEMQQQQNTDVLQIRAEAVVMADNTPDDMPEPKRGWTAEHNDTTYYVEATRRLTDQGWRLRLVEEQVESTAPNYYGRG